MKDTPFELQKKWETDLNSLSPEERLEMACSMFDLSREVVEASLRAEIPGVSESELKRKVFLRFYNNDFPPEICSRILAHL